MKIFAYALREFDEKAFWDRYTAEYGCTYDYTTSYPSPENVELARGCEAISATPCDLGAEMLDRFYAVGVRYIATRSIGVDHIDLEHAKKLGIGVCHVSYDPETVADYAIMLMLMCCRKMDHILERSRVQDYSLQGKMGRDLCDCTVGVIGTGQIGRTVLKHLSTVGCRLIAYDLYPNDAVREYAEYVSLDELYKQSDVITLHTPATAENHHMLGADAFARMKDGVIIVNTARGSLIDADALIDAIERGRVGHAALDVLEDESNLYYANRMGDVIVNRSMAVLRSFPNVMLLPHTAFYTEKVVRAMAVKSIRGILDMQEGRENPLVVVR